MPDNDPADNALSSVDDIEAIRHLKRALTGGKPWHIALLEAIALWTLPEEERNGHCYRYLIDGEAFDWLLLAERLTDEIAGKIPEDELVALLFYGRLPGEITDEVFRKIIGPAKYHAYLNYLYGVVVERFVLIAADEEISKERHSHVFSRREDGQNDAYIRIYGTNQEELLKLFRQEKGYHNKGEMDFDQFQEFTYWLFKYRIEHCDKARVASDTRKGVQYLVKHRRGDGLTVPQKDTQNSVEQGF